MRLQRLTGKFPTDRRPDPANGSPGTLRTVTEAQVQRNVRGRTTRKCRKSYAAVQSTAERAASVQPRDHWLEWLKEELATTTPRSSPSPKSILSSRKEKPRSLHRRRGPILLIELSRVGCGLQSSCLPGQGRAATTVSSSPNAERH
jgi:hypothetical protein